MRGGGLGPGSGAEWVAAGRADHGVAEDLVAVAGLAGLAAGRLAVAGLAEAGRPEENSWKSCSRN